MLILQIDQTSLELSREYLIKGMDDKDVKAYYNFMVDNAVIFGANRTRAEAELKDALEFEMKLANVIFGFILNERIGTLILHIFPQFRSHGHVKNDEMLQHCTTHTQ